MMLGARYIQLDLSVLRTPVHFSVFGYCHFDWTGLRLRITSSHLANLAITYILSLCLVICTTSSFSYPLLLLLSTYF